MTYTFTSGISTIKIEAPSLEDFGERTYQLEK